EPTLLAGVTEDMPVLKEETFGPVAALLAVRDADEAVRVANRSPYGLGAALWTADLIRARALARHIESGSVFINGTVASEPRLALEDSPKITQVVVRHEQGAAFMADVAGRLTSYPGVCLATLGPGATNLLTGVADATLDGAPLVALTGQAGLERIHKRSHQYVDVLGMFAPVVKWGARIELPDGAPEVIRTAFRMARLERP